MHICSLVICRKIWKYRNIFVFCQHMHHMLYWYTCIYIYRYVINACGDIKTSKVSEPHSYFFWRSFSPKHHHVWIMVCLYTFTQNSADLGPQMQIIHILMIFHNFLSSQKTKSQNTQKKNYIAKTNIYNDPWIKFIMTKWIMPNLNQSMV